MRVRLVREGMLALVSGALLCACGGEQPAPGADRPPSVLLILVDALRPDHLGFHGYTEPTSPALDRIAAESLVFDNAYSVSSWTKPSIPSLFTSLYPSQHGVFEGSAHGNGGAPTSDILPDAAVTLAETLQDCGYETAAFVHNAQLRGRFGFRQGFEVYDELDERAPVMVDRTLEWLRRRPEGDAPFFIYLHLLDAHWPYEPSARAARELGLDPSGFGGGRTLQDAVNEGLVTLSEEERQDLIGRYDAEILGVDRELGRLWPALQSLGVWQDLVLVLPADHDVERAMQIGHPLKPGPVGAFTPRYTPPSGIWDRKESNMAQCKAQTANGTRCTYPVAPPSRSLCGRHQNALVRGSRVINAETGRAVPKPR